VSRKPDRSDPSLNSLLTCIDGRFAWLAPSGPLGWQRSPALRALTDSTPSLRVPAVIQALESRRNDPDERIRRRVRKTLAHYRRTGKVTDAAR
jgi:hypothetical protein